MPGVVLGVVRMPAAAAMPACWRQRQYVLQRQPWHLHCEVVASTSSRSAAAVVADRSHWGRLLLVGSPNQCCF